MHTDINIQTLYHNDGNGGCLGFGHEVIVFDATTDTFGYVTTFEQSRIYTEASSSVGAVPAAMQQAGLS